MCFSKLQANKVNPSSPLHRLAAKTQIKLLELEDAAYNNGISIFILVYCAVDLLHRLYCLAPQSAFDNKINYYLYITFQQSNLQVINIFYTSVSLKTLATKYFPH